MGEKAKCKHKWQHFNTIYKRKAYRNHSDYYRDDEFFCEKCAEILTKSRFASGLDTGKWGPDWFENNKAEVINDNRCW